MTTLRQVIDPTGRRAVIWDAPIGRYIRGGKPAIRAFHNVLNKAPGFKGYGLSLTPGDMNSIKRLVDVGTVIIDWFKKKGFSVVI